MIQLRRFFTFFLIAVTISIAMLFVHQVAYADHCDPGGFEHDPNNPEECIPVVQPEPEEDKPTKTPIYVPPTFTATSTETPTPTSTSTATETLTPTHTATATQLPTITATVVPNNTEPDPENNNSLTLLLPLLLLGGYGGYYGGGRGCRRNRDGNLLGSVGSDDLLTLALLGGSIVSGYALGDGNAILPLLLLGGLGGATEGYRRCRRRRRARRSSFGPGGYG